MNFVLSRCTNIKFIENESTNSWNNSCTSGAKMSQQVFCELNYIYKCPPHQTSFSSKLKHRSCSDKSHGLRNMTRQPFTNLHSPICSETMVQNLSNINFREQFNIIIAYILFDFLGLMKPNCIKYHNVTHSQV